MVRDNDETTVEKDLFSGKEKGLSFEKLKCTVQKFTICYARIM